jgi:hypothetical protein
VEQLKHSIIAVIVFIYIHTDKNIANLELNNVLELTRLIDRDYLVNLEKKIDDVTIIINSKKHPRVLKIAYTCNIQQ